MKSIEEQEAFDAYPEKLRLNAKRHLLDANEKKRGAYLQGYGRAREDMRSLINELISAVEQYVEPKPGTRYMHRSKLLQIKNKVKELVK